MKSSILLLTFFILLIVKLDGTFEMSWAITFIPLLVKVAFDLYEDAIAFLDKRDKHDK